MVLTRQKYLATIPPVKDGGPQVFTHHSRPLAQVSELLNVGTELVCVSFVPLSPSVVPEI